MAVTQLRSNSLIHFDPVNLSSSILGEAWILFNPVRWIPIEEVHHEGVFKSIQEFWVSPVSFTLPTRFYMPQPLWPGSKGDPHIVLTPWAVAHRIVFSRSICMPSAGWCPLIVHIDWDPAPRLPLTLTPTTQVNPLGTSWTVPLDMYPVNHSGSYCHHS